MGGSICAFRGTALRLPHLVLWMALVSLGLLPAAAALAAGAPPPEGDVDLAAEWLKMAKDLNPKLDAAECRAKLDALVERAAAAAAPGKTPREKARLLAGHLFGPEGISFRAGGKTPDQFLALKRGDSARLSFLALKGGDCVGLSFLYLCVARRLQMPLFLVLSPEHAFVRYDDGRERFNIETTLRGAIRDKDDDILNAPDGSKRPFVGGLHLASLTPPQALGALLRAWGTELGEKGRHSDACAKFAKAVELCPRYAEAYANWGVALLNLGRPAEACAKFAKAAEINPRDTGVHRNWAMALADLGKPAEACSEFAKAADIKPLDEQAFLSWAAALARTGRPAEAIEKLDRAAELNPALKPKLPELRKELLEKR